MDKRLTIRGHHLKNLRDAALDGTDNYWYSLYQDILEGDQSKQIEIVAGRSDVVCHTCKSSEKYRWHYERCSIRTEGETEHTKEFDETLAKASGFRIGEVYVVNELISKLKNSRRFVRIPYECAVIVKFLVRSVFSPR